MSDYKLSSLERQYELLEPMRIAARHIMRNGSIEVGIATLDAIDKVLLLWIRRGARLDNGSKSSLAGTDE